MNIQEEMALIESEIASLQPTVVDGIHVNNNLHMTMIDGKHMMHSMMNSNI